MFAPPGAKPTDLAVAEWADGTQAQIYDFLVEHLCDKDLAGPATAPAPQEATPAPASEAQATETVPAPKAQAPASAPDVSETATAPVPKETKPASATDVSVAAQAEAQREAPKATRAAKAEGKRKPGATDGPQAKTGNDKPGKGSDFARKRQAENTNIMEKLAGVPRQDFEHKETGHRLRVVISVDSTRTFHWYLALRAYGRTENPTISKTRFEMGLTYWKVRSWFQTSSFQTFEVYVELPRVLIFKLAGRNKLFIILTCVEV